MTTSPELPNPTRQIADWVSGTVEDPISDSAMMCARHAVLDWTGVTLAAAHSDLADAVVGDASKNGETGNAGIVGREEELSTVFAALANGAISHVLDYDDVNTRMRGHPTVTILPAILAAAAGRDCTYGNVLDSLVAGTEAACIVGEMMGPEHYDRGFHTTATVGTIASAAAVSRLMKHSADETETAIGLAATQSAGLRSMFGTMGKPLHAGKAAMNGLLAARWASSGVSAQSGVLDAQLGFGPVLSGDFTPRSIREDKVQPFGIERNVYKYHAACYYTHSAIEALLEVLSDQTFDVSQFKSIQIGLLSSLHSVCDIREPTSGLEVKFSIRHLLAMALQGIDTSDIEMFTDEIATRADLAALRSMIDVTSAHFEHRTASSVEVSLKNGSKVTKEIDVGVPETDLQKQEERLSAKFIALAKPVLGHHAAEKLRDSILSHPVDEPLTVITDQLYGGRRQ